MAGGKKKGRSSCRFLTYTALLLIGTFVFIDVKQNGGWSNSCTSKALNRTGVYDYTHKAYDCASECTHWVHNHIEDTFPGITESTIKHTTPYVELGRDLGIIGMNVFNNAKEAAASRLPIVVDTIESYAPGLIGKTQEVAKTAWATSVTYFETGREYLLTKVFVGKLAPEEILKTITVSVQFGTEKAQEYYSWLYNKIMTAIK